MNVLILDLDDAGIGDVKFMGWGVGNNTPNMDKVARDGIRANRYLTPASVCSASRYGMMTGRITAQNGVYTTLFADTSLNDFWNDSTGISVTDQTLYSLAKDNGYRTAHFGKWHMGADGAQSMADLSVDEYNGWAFPVLPDGTTPTTDEALKGLDPRVAYTQRDAYAADKFIEFAADDEPWLARVAFDTPHYPCYYEQEWLDAVAPANEKEKYRESGEFNRDSARARYLGAIYGSDVAFGRMVAHLKKTGQYDNTIIIITADNGGGTRYLSPTSADQAACMGPYRGCKGNLYNGGIGTFFAMKGGDIPAGGEIDATICGIDFLSTIAEMLGWSTDGTQDGESFLPIMMGLKESRDKPIFWLTAQNNTRDEPPANRSPVLRMHSPAGHLDVANAHDVFLNLDGTRLEIYAERDAEQLNNLAGKISGRITEIYRSALRAWGESLGDVQLRGNAGKLSDEQRTL